MNAIDRQRGRGGSEEHRYDLLVLLVYAILIFPVIYSKFANGLDTSWEYALNRIGLLPAIRFGSDVVCTYGPLGFLQAPMYIGKRYLIAGGIFLAYWISSVVVFRGLMRDGAVEARSVVLSLFFLFIGQPPRLGELYVLYCGMMALAALWKDMKNLFAVMFYILSATIAFYMKISVATAIAACAVMLAAVKIRLGEGKRVWILLLPCLTVIIAYWLYNPSLSGFIGYIRGGRELTSGYSTAMSFSTLDPYAMWFFIMMAVYIAIIVDAFRHGSENGYLLIWMAPCLFMAYKHGFVRADTKHVVDASAEITSMFSILLLLFRFQTPGKKQGKQSWLMIALICLFLLSYENGIQPFKTLLDRFTGIPKAIEQMSENGYRENREEIVGIPEFLLETIGDETFTSYPTEITFIEKDPETVDNFIPLASLQAYSTYTPYLDRLVAAQLSADEAPKYIIFRFDTIDHRLPIIEVPAVWKAIISHYRICPEACENGWYLFERKKSGTSVQEQSAEVATYKKADVMRFENCSEARIHVDLNLWGKVTGLFWKIPEVMAKVTYTDGQTRQGRVLPENLRDGVLIRKLPYDHNTLFNAMQSDGLICSIRSIELYGPGLKYYRDDVRVETVRYADDGPPDFADFRQVQLDLSKLIPGVEDEARAYIDSIQTEPYLSCYGWAVCFERNAEYRLYVQVRGNYYECVRLPGQDVADYFELNGNRNVRFHVCAPVRADEDSTLLMVSGDRYYEFPLIHEGEGASF